MVAQRISSTVGSPTATTLVTPNGSHPAINFSGGDTLFLNDSAALGVQNISTYVVGTIAVGGVSRIFVTDFSSNNGWASGISDTSTDQTKWYTGHSGAASLEQTTGLTMTPATAYLIAASTSSTGGTNASLFDGTTTQTASGSNTSILYAANPVGAIGSLINAGQFLNGKIAEVLVYDSSALSVFSNAAVTQYPRSEVLHARAVVIRLGRIGVSLGGWSYISPSANRPDRLSVR